MEASQSSYPKKNDDNEEEPVDPICEQFDGVLATLTTFKSQITSLQQQLRGLERVVKRELNTARKAAEKKRKRKAERKPSGFAKPVKVSGELCQFMKVEKDTLVARTDVTRFINKYIKDNKLEDSKKRSSILPNEQLKTLLKLSDNDELTYFNLQKHMNIHYV